MRVLHISPELFGHDGRGLGGAERYALELAKNMSSRTRTRLVSFGDEAAHFRDNNLDIEVLAPSRYVRGMRQNPLSRKLLQHLRWAEVIHCHQQRTVTSTISAVFARTTGRSVFVTDHGGGGWDLSSYVRTDGLYDGLLHVSPYSAAVSGQAFRGNSDVIWGGVDTTHFVPPSESAVRQDVVLFVGRLTPSKGVNYLIEAMPPAVRLEIIGPANDKRYLADLARLAEGKHVTFNHNCGEKDLVAAYQRSACLVLPSVYRQLYGKESRIPELLGQTLLEGMATATPVICTDVAAMPQVVDDGVTGIVVPPNDPSGLQRAILRLLEDRSWAATLGRAGRATVLSRFSWDQVTDRCLERYHRARKTESAF